MEENKNNSMSKDHVVAILEDINGKFDFLVEGQKVLEDKVNDLSEKVELLAEDMDYVKGKLVQIDEKLNNKAEKAVVNDHKNRLAKLENAALAG